MENDTDYAPIKLIPSEIFSMILMENDFRDAINLGLTCKHLNLIMRNNHYLWKKKLKEFLPPHIFNTVEEYTNGNWFEHFNIFHRIHKEVYQEITTMSAKYFARVDCIKMKEVSIFFNLALTDNFSYYYVIYLLQDIIKGAREGPMDNQCLRTFSLTEAYYSKEVLRYLIQTHLAVKWVQAHITNELHPEVVLNFFMQWMDPGSLHSDEDVEIAINNLVRSVDILLPHDENSSDPISIPEKVSIGIVTQKDVIRAISYVLYRRLQISTTSHADMETLNILQVIKKHVSTPITSAVIYNAVAKKCGIKFQLIAFPHHLILEWKNPVHGPLQYKIELETGYLVPKAQCPFSRHLNRTEYKYCPDLLLQYIVSSYLKTKELVSDWYILNSSSLVDFFSTNPSEQNPYRNFLSFLLDHKSALSEPVQLKVLSDTYMEMIQKLSCLNPDPPSINRKVIPKIRNSALRYAVGMVCYHKKYEYLCVIRGWDRCCSEKNCTSKVCPLEFGHRQPFYITIALDTSTRYVAQENLGFIQQPDRLYHLEDAIAKEFTHFDGFAYVPNSEKENEYPQDYIIRNVFRANAGCRQYN